MHTYVYVKLISKTTKKFLVTPGVLLITCMH